MCTVNNEDTRIDEYSPRKVEITGRNIYIYIPVKEFSYKSGKWGNSLSLFGSMVT